MIRVSRDISDIAPYIPGKPMAELEREIGISGSIKLASNENPLGASKKAMMAIRTGLKEIRRYPDGAAFRLKEALSERWKVSQDQVLIGNGSNEVIELLVRTFILPGDEAIMAQPTFSLYRLMIQAGHGHVISIPLKEGCHDLPEMARAVTSKTKLIFICNPNNPTGTMVDQGAVERFLSQLPTHVLVVFDEAYAEYVCDPDYPQSVSLLKEGAPLIVLRTFSKIYGLAGLRVGYGVSHPQIIGFMNRVRQPFNVNLPAQQGALAALLDEDHLLRSRKVNQKGKAYMMRQFDRMGISYFASEANFIYFHLQGKDSTIGEKVQKELLKKGVIIRYLGERHLRVTIGRPGENRRFIAALKAVLSGH